MEFEPVIGLEVHAQLLTRSKMFCGCSAAYADAPPNTHVCPVCMGAPGVMPVINEEAVRDTVKVALALHCEIPPFSKFDRKNYPYPDLVKGYQISQYDMPMSRHGYLDVAMDGATFRVGIVRVHLEEDTAKLLHRLPATRGPRADGAYSLMDINRSGVPLMEIVSAPDIHSPEQARAYAQTLRSVLQYLGVNEGDMEKGSLRCDANISLRPRGTTGLGVKTEVKNMNSFRALQAALAYEIRRQAEVLRSGGTLVQETRGWDEARGETLPQRSKEFAHDYRYFPEPDLPPLEFSPAYVEEVRASLPELADARRARLMAQYGLREADAATITASKALADFYEAAVVAAPDGAARTMANYLLSDVGGLLNAQGIEIDESKLTPKNLAAVVRLLQDGTLNSKTARAVLEETFTTGKDPAAIVKEKGLTKIADPAQLEPIVRTVVASSSKPVADYRAGKTAALEVLVGKVMAQTRGRADTAVARELLQKALAE
jgi:aspartyl-tRNA(Asn)/glutamyl-tRNA(Gln) amidotransferase subunit B